MLMHPKSKNVQAISNSAIPLRGRLDDFDPLLERIGSRSLVLIGEASHGTQEFYQLRASITRRLILDKGFTAVAIAADWPDVWRINRYVGGKGPERDAEQALGDFRRFPRWLWRNTAMANFLDWLRQHNQRLTQRPPARLYGLDLFSLYNSLHGVISYLGKQDREAARRARERYACFDHLGKRPETYGRGVSIGLRRNCTAEAVAQLAELRRDAARYLAADGLVAEEEQFFAEQNARAVEQAGSYYRKMFEWPDVTWNLRDQHMTETLEALVQHLRRQGLPPKIVVWAHNSHLGDARATEVAQEGQVNLGQLVRERFGEESFLIGQTTYSGTVAAASQWDGAVEHRRVRPALSDSVEDVFHQTGIPSFLLWPAEQGLSTVLGTQRLHRAIGVIYRPETERQSHYLYCRMARQFDAVLHTDQTSALLPLDLAAEYPAEQPPAPEAWPLWI